MTTIEPEGRRLLRLEVRNSETPIERKPAWIKTKLRTGPEFTAVSKLVKDEGLHTVCQEAGCPNIYECWEDREATFLIGGEQCTRRCDFCQIDTGKPSAARSRRTTPRRRVRTHDGFKYATVTGVARDDLVDEGAWLYAETIRQDPCAQPRLRCGDSGPRLSRARPELLGEVFDAAPRGIRPQPRDRPAHLQAHQTGLLLRTIARCADPGPRRRMVTKSNLILGLGETSLEIEQRSSTCTQLAANSSPSRNTFDQAPATTPSSDGSNPVNSTHLADRATRSASRA